MMTATMEDRHNDPISSQATAWMVLFQSGEATSEDRTQFAQWLAEDPTHHSAYIEAQTFWKDLDSLDEDDVQEIRNLTNDLDEPARPSSLAVRLRSGRDWRRSAAVAACLALTTMCGLWAAQAWHLGADYRTGTGEQRTVTLSDGSTVVLNAETALSVSLTEGVRHLVLHEGEALFTVKPDSQRPFEVEVGAGVVQALGTAFNIKTEAYGVAVTVAEHAVRVRTGTHTADVSSGQRIVYRTGWMGTSEKVDVARTLAWQRHRLIFEEQLLEEVVEELSRYRSGWIVIRDASLRALRVTGVFDTAHPEHLIPALVESLPIRAVSLTDRLVLIDRDPTRSN
ncbi:MAG: FecR family protein [Nitrospira sp.]